MITKNIIVDCLLNHTKNGDFKWREDDHGIRFIEINSIKIELGNWPKSTANLVTLKFTWEKDKDILYEVDLIEPESDYVFTRKYNSEEDQELVDSLRHLDRVVSNQLAIRSHANIEHREEIAQKVFRQLLFGNEATK